MSKRNEQVRIEVETLPRRKLKTMGRRFEQQRSTRRNWIWKSEHCEKAKADGAATDRSPMGAALIQPSWNSSSRWRQQFAILQDELDRVFDVQHQLAPATPVHKVPGGQSEKSNHTRKEQENIGTRSRGSQRTVIMDRQYQRSQRMVPGCFYF